MNAALAEFAARGYPHVTVEEIAEAAGVTKGAFYYWFRDKDDLGRDLQHELWDRITSRGVSTFDSSADVVTSLRRGFEAHLEALDDLGAARFFLREAWAIPGLDAAGRVDHDAAIELFAGMLRAAIERGELIPLDAEALARVLLGAFAEGTLHVLTTGEPGPTLAVIECLLEPLRVQPARRPSRNRSRAS
ncbi:MAG: TetR/AcrR family transcriptional regulator [Acidimicrobiia bacterium]